MRSLFSLILVTIVAGAALWTLASMPVRYVRFEGGLQSVDTALLEKALAPEMERDYPWLRLDDLSRAVRAVPWVGGARIVRAWPDTLVVMLDEVRPVARWGTDGLVSVQGARLGGLAGSEAFADLPELNGPPGQERPMLTVLHSMNQRLAGLGRHIVSMRLSERRAWSFRLDDGLVVELGRDDPMRAFDRFLRVVRLLGVEKLATVVRIDLRYPNGFAVREKTGESLKMG